jgi:hypothetical protein
MIGDTVKNKHVETVASSDAATQSATQFKQAITNTSVNTSTAQADCMSPARATPQHRRRALQKVSADTDTTDTG